VRSGAELPDGEVPVSPPQAAAIPLTVSTEAS
jgi:hypothetical protein